MKAAVVTDAGGEDVGDVKLRCQFALERMDGEVQPCARVQEGAVVVDEALRTVGHGAAHGLVKAVLEQEVAQREVGVGVELEVVEVERDARRGVPSGVHRVGVGNVLARVDLGHLAMIPRQLEHVRALRRDAQTQGHVGLAVHLAAVAVVHLEELREIEGRHDAIGVLLMRILVDGGARPVGVLGIVGGHVMAGDEEGQLLRFGGAGIFRKIKIRRKSNEKGGRRKSIMHHSCHRS